MIGVLILYSALFPSLSWSRLLLLIILWSSSVYWNIS